MSVTRLSLALHIDSELTCVAVELAVWLSVGLDVVLIVSSGGDSTLKFTLES